MESLFIRSILYGALLQPTSCNQDGGESIKNTGAAVLGEHEGFKKSIIRFFLFMVLAIELFRISKSRVWNILFYRMYANVFKNTHTHTRTFFHVFLQACTFFIRGRTSFWSSCLLETQLHGFGTTRSAWTSRESQPCSQIPVNSPWLLWSCLCGFSGHVVIFRLAGQQRESGAWKEMERSLDEVRSKRTLILELLAN